MNIEWTDRARIDLADIVTYIAEDSPDAAARLKARLEEVVAYLAGQPGMGRPGRIDGTRNSSWPGRHTSFPIGCVTRQSRSWQ